MDITRLLGRKAIDSSQGTTQVIQPKMPEGQIPKALADFETLRNYEQMADSLGFCNAELIRAQLLEFLEIEEIQIYKYPEVKAWLTAKKVEAGAKEWCWRPLRAKDVNKDIAWSPREGNGYRDGFYTNYSGQCPPYRRIVPGHALEKVALIESQEKFKDRVLFFVSDYPSPTADPFLMVRPNMPIDQSQQVEDYLLVIDVWDEPGFGVDK